MQAPFVHAVAPLAFVHATPQPPQFVRLVASVASQPFAALPSQFPKPALQVAMPQTPEAHDAVAFGTEQAFPHAPQLVTVVWVFVSQPFDEMPSQLPQPATQLGTHAPVVQVVVPWAFVQPFPHAPQLVSVVCVFVSQPFDVCPSQFANPLAQVPSVQLPPTHVSEAFARSHTTLQPPQSVSVLMLFSQPLLGFPSQLAKSDAQVGVHAPDTQAVEPFAFEHVAPHAPQFAVVESAISQPFEARPSQLPKPALHAMPQAPVLHDGVPLFALQA